MLLLLGLTATAQERVTVDDVTITQGREAVLAVRFQFNEGHEYVSYQFTVDLPSGVSLVTGDYALVPVTLGDGQPSALYYYSMRASSRIMMCYSNPSTPIAGSSGLLVEIPIVADDDLAAGSTLTGQLKDVEFTKNIGAVRTPFANVPINITVKDRAEESELAGVSDARVTYKSNGAVYDLQGRHVDRPVRKGVYIKNGKKNVIR